MQTVKTYVVCLLSISTLLSCSGNSERIETAESFRKARAAHDYKLASKFLAENARIWFESREGDGAELGSGGGPWTNWDIHFKSGSTHGKWFENGDSVWTIVTEMNDYYKLIERASPGTYRATYYFNADGFITGYLVSEPDPLVPRPPPVDRLEEIRDWAIENYPGEWDYLRPDGNIDPSEDRPARTRHLINLWRVNVGLPEIK
jgi:hypothetical protein